MSQELVIFSLYFVICFCSKYFKLKKKNNSRTFGMIFATLLVVVTHGLKGHSSSLWESQHDRSVRQLVHLRSGSYER